MSWSRAAMVTMSNLGCWIKSDDTSLTDTEQWMKDPCHAATTLIKLVILHLSLGLCMKYNIISFWISEGKSKKKNVFLHCKSLHFSIFSLLCRQKCKSKLLNSCGSVFRKILIRRSSGR